MDSLSVLAPRCPFCHEDVASGGAQVGCNGCRAWHHEACWSEGGKRCSACRGTRTGVPAALSATPPREIPVCRYRTAHALALLLSLGSAVLESKVLPAFRRFFQDTGLPVRPLTEWVVYGWGNVAFLAGALLLLHLGCLARHPAAKKAWAPTLFAWLTAWVGVTTLGLCLPVLTLIERV
jgi:hypothetical protein